MLTPGRQTSEYTQTLLANIIGGIGVVTGAIIALGPQLMTVVPKGSKMLAVLGTIVSIAGIVHSYMISQGYVKGRTELKLAAMKSEG
jgi:hypothetical protein